MNKPLLFAIDDDSIVLKVYPKRLDSFEVVTFRGGEDAIEQVKMQRPDIIICDLCMPFLDGYATVERIHAIDPTIPIIIATALDGDKHKIAAEAYGCHYWHKSHHYDELRELVTWLTK